VYRLFRLAPLSLTLLFPFGVEGDKMYDTPAYRETAQEFAFTIDFVVMSLGSDMDMVFTQLLEISQQHAHFQRVRPEHWQILGRALMGALDKTLGGRMNDATRDCWASAFDTVSTGMIQGMSRCTAI
jgi:hemoglobin-like flavoprotein